jgi:hypothetical protein
LPPGDDLLRRSSEFDESLFGGRKVFFSYSSIFSFALSTDYVYMTIPSKHTALPLPFESIQRKETRVYSAVNSFNPFSTTVDARRLETLFSLKLKRIKSRKA